MDPLTRLLMQGAAGAGGDVLGIEDVFSTWLYTGNGSTQTITNGIDLAGEGGLVWLKSRVALDSPYTNLEFNCLFDNVRSGATGGSAGGGGRLRTDSTQGAQSDTYLDSYNSDGFTLADPGVVSNANLVNQTGKSFVSWTFRKAPGFFDIVTWTGDGVAGRSISHGLGSTPGFIIVKNISASSNWAVFHRSLNIDDYILLNLTNAVTPNITTIWNSTSPTSSHFTVGTSHNVNRLNDQYVAYLFAHDEQIFGEGGDQSVIKCGSYTGNGSTTGPTVNLGWEPQWLLIKRTDAAGESWFLVDSMRGLTVAGSDDEYLLANSSNAAFSTSFIAPLATGFQLNSTSGAFNASGGTYIYIAIRRGPMKTPEDATEVFDDVTYTGTASAQDISISPDYADLVFIKRRTSTDPPVWTDRLRGKDKYLRSSGTDAEATWGTNDVIEFDQQESFGLVGNQSGYVNSSGQPYISYNFRRAPGFFDVVAYTGNSTAGRTVNHNLGVVPELMIVKARSGAVNQNWFVYNKFDTATDYLLLNDTAGANPSTSVWNDTEPTSSVFTVGLSTFTNATNYNYIAYLFATLPGVSKVGSYTGTGTTLNIDCGFTSGARLVIIKRTDSTGSWYVWDTARGIVSGNDSYLLLNSTAAEVTNTDYIDPLSSGFQITSTAPAAINASGGSFIFLAVA